MLLHPVNLTLIAIAVLSGPTARAQAVAQNPVIWTAAAPANIAAGSAFEIGLRAAVDDGWKLYSLTQPAGGPIRTSITVAPASGFTAGAPLAPDPEEYPDRNFGILSQVYHDSVSISLPVRAARSLERGTRTVPIVIRYQSCTDRYCLPPRTDTVAVKVGVRESSATLSSTADSLFPPAPMPQPAAEPLADTVASASAPVTSGGSTQGFGGFLLAAFGMGLLAILTPCILPMIPISAAVLSPRQGSSGNARALAFAIGVIGAFVALGLGASMLVGAAAMVRLAANPWLNAAIAMLFGFFALSFLGLVEIALPWRLMTRISAVGGNGTTVVSAGLMGIAFAITSFTCTAPFIGTLLVLATRGSWQWPLAGLTTYAVAFALPFVVIALAPSALGRLPRTGAWMLTLKRSLGVIELALAVKFLSNADLVLGTGLLSREVVIGSWTLAVTAIALIIARDASLRMSVRLPLTVAALAGAVWITAGIRGRSLGELEAYLPPRHGDLSWATNDYEGGLAMAAADGKPLFVDFTGYTCTNCRWMEANMFERPEVRERLERYARVRLYTDGQGPVYERQQRLQERDYGTVALPYYAVVGRDGKPIATFLGMTRDPEEFIRFLDDALTTSHANR